MWRWGQHTIYFFSRLENSFHRKHSGRPPAMNNHTHAGEIRNEGGCFDTRKAKKKGDYSPRAKKPLKTPSSLTPNPHNLRACYLRQGLQLNESHFLICTTEITLRTAPTVQDDARQCFLACGLQTTCTLGSGGCPSVPSPCSFLPNRASILFGHPTLSKWLQKYKHLQ